MMRPLAALLTLLISACAAERPLPDRYDLDAPRTRSQPDPRLDTTLAVPPINAPSWLRTTALIYRLDYEPPAHPRAYVRSQWAAPPNELLSLRLRERISAVNDGFTNERLPEDMEGYHLEVTLEDFTQAFPSADHSQCVVTVSVLLRRGDRMLAQKTFHAERSAPTADAAGAVVGLTDAADADFAQLLTWLHSTLPPQHAAATAAAEQPDR
ncbi:MAG: membrane integrity-associated transporter subunit PqiC [Gammaproteobacteria bacterium]|nr:membrane integrity-associated transporter subunit PqiC [Gammaproteobacteria bacterium]